MTTTYDPTQPLYLDESDVRGEMTRAFGLCNGCRACVDLCGVFPTLFRMLERRADQDPGRLTPAQQDRVVDQCVQCKRCADDCPYIGRPVTSTIDATSEDEASHLDLDVPRLMLRARAMQHDVGLTSWRSRAATQIAGRADLVGRLATRAPALATRLLRADPPFTAPRFSKWFNARSRSQVPGSEVGSAVPSDSSLRRVTVFPTCLVEYREPEIGRNLVAGYEARGLECSLSQAGCCGAPWLHAGEIKKFAKVAGRNVEQLAAEVRQGTDIVVAGPMCAHVLTHAYVDHVGGPDAVLVADHTFDAADY